MKNGSCEHICFARKDNLLVKTHSVFSKGLVLSECYCTSCGQKASFVLDSNDFVIDIEHFNIPPKPILQEYKVLKRLFASNNQELDLTVAYNILYAIAWAYEVDYYKNFATYYFVDVRNAIAEYILANRDKLSNNSLFFLETDDNYNQYISSISQILDTNNRGQFDLVDKLQSFFTLNDIFVYGPVASVYMTYYKSEDTSCFSNNYYYKSDKYFWDHRQDLQNEANKLHAEIIAHICAKLRTCGSHLDFTNAELSLNELRIILVNSSDNSIIVNGILSTFSEIFNYDIYRELTVRTYKENLEILENALAFVQEHC